MPSVTTPICTEAAYVLPYDAIRLQLTFQANSSDYPRQYDSVPFSKDETGQSSRCAGPHVRTARNGGRSSIAGLFCRLTRWPVMVTGQRAGQGLPDMQERRDIY